MARPPASGRPRDAVAVRARHQATVGLKAPPKVDGHLLLLVVASAVPGPPDGAVKAPLVEATARAPLPPKTPRPISNLRR